MLSGVDWDSDLNFNHSNYFERFLSCFLEIFNICFPYKDSRWKNSKMKSSLNQGLPWYNDDLKIYKANIRKWHTFIKWCDRFDITNNFAKAEFLKAKKEYKLQLKNAKFSYNEHFINNSRNKCKAAWSVINRVKNCNTVQQNNCDLTPDIFKEHFCNSVRDIQQRVPPCLLSAKHFLDRIQRNQSLLAWKPVSCLEISKIIKNMKNSNSKDIFDIDANLVKEVLPFIAQPLTKSINQCLENGIFPETLKLAKTVPIHKKGDPSDANNYRPISIVPIFSKIIETVMNTQLIAYLEQNSILSQSQFGFRRGLSTIDAIEELVSSILMGFENHKSTMTILCDMSKAFDCVSHEILYYKLEYYGVTGAELSLFKSYLSDRYLKVCYNGILSDSTPVKCGVPQGSVLGPVLFLLAINDLPSNISTECVLFADDTSLYHSDKDLLNLNTVMTESLNNATLWFQANGFSLNLSKTQKILFSLKDTMNTQFQTNVKLLGLILDPKVSWDSQIEHLCARLSRVIYLLRQLKSLVSKSYLRMSYFAFFNSLLLYGITIWGNSPGVSKLLILQKKAIRIITGAQFNEHCRPLFKKEHIFTIVNLYIFECLLTVKRGLNEYSSAHDVHNHNTRSNYLLIEPAVRLCKTKRSFHAMSLKLFNKLPQRAHDISLPRFRATIQRWLAENPFYKVEEFYEQVGTLQF